MLYRSTRGHPKLLRFREAILQGLAPDGGLYIPESIPTFSLEEISSWRTLSFAQLAFKLYRPFIEKEEINDDELLDLCTRSFATFSHPQVAPTKKLPTLWPNAENKDFANIWVLELFHGPTFAFKDVALQFLGNLFEFFLKKKKSSRGITVVGATSGDTGGAAIYGLRGKEKINVFILHPHKRVSPIQEAQMTSVLDANIHNVAVEGSFDDCQDIVKALFSDAAFKEQYQLGAINSINWARIMAQTTYYFYSYFSVLKQQGVPFDVSSYLGLAKIQFSVPSGNFGDVLAGFYAKQMGLPIDHFIVATNENDILDRFLKSGKYDKQEKRDGVDPVKQTLSPAMDILISSNFERLLWYVCQDDQEGIPHCLPASQAEKACKTINSYFSDLKQHNVFQVSEKSLQKARALFSSHRVNDEETSDAVRRYFHHQYNNNSSDEEPCSYVLDPHTAVGVVAAEVFLGGKGKRTRGLHTVILSTASPGKFPDAVMNAINHNPPIQAVQQGFKPLSYADFAPRTLVELQGLPQRMTLVASDGGKFEKALQRVRQTIIGTLGGNSKL